eukprot:scaffold173893_cov24-Tisochrysis_lutea.AAC.3
MIVKTTNIPGFDHLVGTGVTVRGWEGQVVGKSASQAWAESATKAGAKKQASAMPGEWHNGGAIEPRESSSRASTSVDGGRGRCILLETPSPGASALLRIPPTIALAALGRGLRRRKW